MTLVEGEFGQQHGISRQLVKLSQQVDRSVVNHEEDIQIVFIMAEIDGAFFFGAKVILPLLERMPQKAVAVRGPVEGSGGGYVQLFWFSMEITFPLCEKRPFCTPPP